MAQPKATKPGNKAPVAGDDGPYSTAYNTDLILDASTLLANDTDPDKKDALSITEITTDTGGAATLIGTKIVFNPDDTFLGAASFTYRVSDGNGGTDTADVQISVAPPLPVVAPPPSPEPPTSSEPAFIKPVNLTAEGNLVGILIDIGSPRPTQVQLHVEFISNTATAGSDYYIASYNTADPVVSANATGSGINLWLVDDSIYDPNESVEAILYEVGPDNSWTKLASCVINIIDSADNTSPLG